MSNNKRIALITGASSGMGLELAKQIGATGGYDELWLVARDKDKREKLADALAMPTIALQPRRIRAVNRRGSVPDTMCE